MSRFEDKSTIKTSCAFQACLSAAEHCVSLCGVADVKTQSTDFPVATQVSGTVGNGVKLRLLGALMAPKHWIPLRVTISVADDGEMRTVTCTVEDNFGFGSLIGVESKFKARCKEVHDLLMQTLQRNLTS